MGLTFDLLYTAEILEMPEALDTLGGDPEGMKVQKTMTVRVVLVIEDTEDLDNGLDAAAGQVAVWVFLIACSEVQGVCCVATIGR